MILHIFLTTQRYGDAKIWGYAKVSGSASVCDNAKVYGDAYVNGSARVWGNAKVYGDAMIDYDVKDKEITE